MFQGLKTLGVDMKRAYYEDKAERILTPQTDRYETESLEICLMFQSKRKPSKS